jgi:hypothetical protein
LPKIEWGCSWSGGCNIDTSTITDGKHPRAVISSTRSQLKCWFLIRRVRFLPPQTVHSWHMTHQRIKPEHACDAERGRIWANIWSSSTTWNTPELDQSIIHANSNNTSITSTVPACPGQCCHTVTEQRQCCKQLDGSILNTPYLDSLVPWTSCKFVPKWVPRACPYDSFVCFMLCNQVMLCSFL